MIRTGILGGAGRMGLRLVAMVAAHDKLELAAAIDQPTHPKAGQDIGPLAGLEPLGVPLTGQLPTDLDVLIDFSAPASTRAALAHCAEHDIAMVIGTTGLTDDDQKLIDQAATKIPIVVATNFSLVVNVLNDLAARAAKMLGEDYDIEILEAHHRFKKDAPSGTALTLAQRICQATGRSFQEDVICERHGDNVPREPGQITIQALRIGDHVGEHTAYFAALGERLEIKHVSTSRDSYAGGAVRAAAWLAGKPAGRYDVTQVLGIA